MNVLLNILKMLVIVISSFLFVQRMIRESQTLDFAVWNDFRIREPNSKVKNFQDSQVAYSKSLKRFLSVHRRQKNRFHVEMSRKVDIFESFGSTRLKFFPLLKIIAHYKSKVSINSSSNFIKIQCPSNIYRIKLLNSSSVQTSAYQKKHSVAYGRNETYEAPCFRVTGRSNVTFTVTEKQLTRDQTEQIKVNLQMELMMRKHKIHKMIFSKRCHGSHFFVGIDSEKFFIFQLRNSSSVAKRIGTVPIEGTFPFASILKCSTKMNCLNIKVFYNRYDRIHFLYLPPKNLLMVYKKYQTLASEFSGFSMKSLNNMKLHIDRNLIISRVFTLPENDFPYLEINMFKYNIQQRRYRVLKERLNFVNFADSFSEISKLVFMDRTGLFNQGENKNVFSDTIITSEDGNSKMICLFLQNKRIICSLMLFNFRKPNSSKEEHLKEYAAVNAKALLILCVAFILAKGYFCWRKSAK